MLLTQIYFCKQPDGFLKLEARAKVTYRNRPRHACMNTPANSANHELGGINRIKIDSSSKSRYSRVGKKNP